MVDHSKVGTATMKLKWVVGHAKTAIQVYSEGFIFLAKTTSHWAEILQYSMSSGYGMQANNAKSSRKKLKMQKFWYTVT